jgi:hypothetical protein
MPLRTRISTQTHQLIADSPPWRHTTNWGYLSQVDSPLKKFVEFGYPWSDLSEAKRGSGEYDDLRKPGWLPTAVVVNILGINDRRRGRGVNRSDLITVHDDDDTSASVVLPSNFTGPEWKPSDLPPIEVIDGQHRLWAFGADKPKGRYEIPVVAFLELDLSWQAYQFWTINIKPKKINQSLAFDLYPLLRTEDWLEKFDGHPIYRETRSQELVQHLWSQPESPWYQRINMLGEPGLGRGMVSQASWIRSLMATFVRSRDRGRIGGLFASPSANENDVLPWSRAQQAAFLIFIGIQLRDAVRSEHGEWAEAIRAVEPRADAAGATDPAFASAVSLLATDIGIRGLLYATNDLCCHRSQDLELANWVVNDSAEPDTAGISAAVKSLDNTKVGAFLGAIAERLARFDWRSSAAPGLGQQEITLKQSLRGNGGYKVMRRLLLEHLSGAGGKVGSSARSVSSMLNLS